LEVFEMMRMGGWILASALVGLAALTAGGCGPGDADEEIKALENANTDLNRQLREKGQKVKEQDDRIAALEARKIELEAKLSGTEVKAVPASEAERRIQRERLIQSYSSALYQVRGGAGSVVSPATAISGADGQRYLLCGLDSYKQGGGLHVVIHPTLLTDRYLPANLKGKSLDLEEFDVAGIDQAVGLVVGVLQVHDSAINAPPLGDESKMKTLAPVYHIGWPTRDGRPPANAEVADARSDGAIASLPEEDPDRLMKVTFRTPGLYEKGDPIFDAADRLVGLIKEVAAPTAEGTTVRCLPASRLAGAVDRLMGIRRKTIVGTFHIEAKVQSMLLTADGKLLAGLAEKGDAVLVFSAEDGKQIAHLQTDPKPVSVAQCDGKLFVASLLGQNIAMYDLANIGVQEPKPVKLGLPAQPALIAAPTGGVGEQLIVLVGPPEAQAVVPIRVAEFGSGAGAAAAKPKPLDDLGQAVRAVVNPRLGIGQMVVSADGSRLYLVGDGAKPRAVALDVRGDFALVGQATLAGPKLEAAAYGGLLLAGGQTYDRDLIAAPLQAEGFLACFNPQLPYFTAFQTRGREGTINVRQPSELAVDVLSIYSVAQQTGISIGTLPLPAFPITWAMLAPDGRLLTVNDKSGRCAILRTDAAALRAQCPNPIVNVPDKRLLLGESFAFEPRLLTPPAPSDTFAASGMPEGMTVDAATGKLVWTPGPADAGQRSIAIEYRPASGIVSRLTIPIEVGIPSLELATADTFVLPRLLASADGKRLYALDAPNAQVIEIDAAALKIVRRIVVGARPVDAGWRQDRLYVLCAGSKTIDVVDPAEGRSIEQIALQGVTEPFALAVSSGPTIFVGHSGSRLLAVSAGNPARGQEPAVVRRKSDQGRWGQYEDFSESFDSLATDARGLYLAANTSGGKYVLYGVTAGKLSEDVEPEPFVTASDTLIERFRRLAAVSFVDGTRKRWFVRNRIYDLRGATAKSTTLTGELAAGSADWERVYCLDVARSAEGPGVRAGVRVGVHAAEDLKELAAWDLPGISACDVLQVTGGLALFDGRTVYRIPVDLSALSAAATQPAP
jgi:DNA-binding beta-propeller fold protein YncE